jgi:hypothetical protein
LEGFCPSSERRGGGWRLGGRRLREEGGWRWGRKERLEGRLINIQEEH